MSLRSIAIYLPQFHPIKENDEWWGKGFTEWKNVVKAQPKFVGHYQPHLPADLGFYDLRLTEVLCEQAALAGASGIHGFCFYHYWFNGKRLLNTPLDNMLRTQKPDFPYMICWANENWTRRWDGLDNEILIKQNYGFEDDVEHINFIADHFFSDDRYIKVDGKPVFVIYRPSLFPDIKKTISIWRDEISKKGLPGIYLAYIQSFNCKVVPQHLGFDAAIEFQPDFFEPSFSVNIKGSFLTRLLNKVKLKKSIYTENRVIDYDKFVTYMINRKQKEYSYYPCVTPCWDNSPRKRNAIILHNSTPGAYKKWLLDVKKKFKPSSQEENFIFINAWNEWGEGCYLEPDQKWDKQYLNATYEALNSDE